MHNGNDQSGFSYLLLLVWITIFALMLMKSQDLLISRFRHQQEEQLLFNGNQIREAISNYRGKDNPDQGKGSQKKEGCFPTRFEQLIKDNRSLKPLYHLRKHYADPLVPKRDWIKIFDEEGRWIGVHSSGTGHPMKKTGFADLYKEFSKAKSYQDWEFKVEEDLTAPLPVKCG